MIFIDPFVVKEEHLISTSVDENDHLPWSSSTTYAAGDRVISTSTHKIYQSKVGSNLNQNPTTDSDGSHWAIVGSTNRWRPFDNRISDRVTVAGSMTYTVSPGVVCNAIAIFGLSAASCRVEVIDDVDGLTFDQTYSLIDNSLVSDWYEYFYSPVRRQSTLVLDYIPLMSTGRIRITVSDPSGADVQMGEIVIGFGWELGLTMTNPKLGITDYSSKEIDEFGNVQLIEGKYADNIEFSVVMKSTDAARVRELLSSSRAKGAVWHDGQNNVSMGTAVFGFFRDFSIDLVSNETAYTTIQVEGLT